MDERTYCLTPEQWRHAKACLTLAKRWGLIGDDSPEALERRRAAKNAQAERAEQDGKPVYGTRRFSAPAYLQYELKTLSVRVENWKKNSFMHLITT